MVAIEDVRSAVAQIVQTELPSVEMIRVDAQDRFDSDGQRSLFITAIIKQRPLAPRQLARVSSSIVNQLRAWLGGHDDDRFPYFDFLTEQDEQELRDAI